MELEVTSRRAQRDENGERTREALIARSVLLTVLPSLRPSSVTGFFGSSGHADTSSMRTKSERHSSLVVSVRACASLIVAVLLSV